MFLKYAIPLIVLFVSTSCSYCSYLEKESKSSIVIYNEELSRKKSIDTNRLSIDILMKQRKDAINFFYSYYKGERINSKIIEIIKQWNDYTDKTINPTIFTSINEIDRFMDLRKNQFLVGSNSNNDFHIQSYLVLLQHREKENLKKIIKENPLSKIFDMDTLQRVAGAAYCSSSIRNQFEVTEYENDLLRTIEDIEVLNIKIFNVIQDIY
ncbi:MAG: hypothetical protein IJ730_00270, partial [Alphaproteobacteria bacterium]|nr:hypothetical protein [Alphaproteobacteria bacterium]